MKLKFFKILGCISSDNNLEPHETIQKIQAPKAIHPENKQVRFSKFELISLKAAQEKQLQNISSTNHIRITPDVLQKQLSCLKKIDNTTKNSVDLYSLDNNSAEHDILIKYNKSVETKETKVSDVSISESQNDQNPINSDLIEELDALIRELQMYTQEVTQSADICEVNIPGELNDVIISNDKENYTALSPMSCSNIVGGSFPPVDNIHTESSTLLGNS